MNTREKFNEIIDFIENAAFSKDHRSAVKIAENVLKKTGMGGREINAVFVFLIGMPLLEYIKERKMMASYSVLINADQFDANAALETAGYDTQSSYGKKFKERFNMTPTEAHARKSAALFAKPFTWENISSNDNMFANKLEEIKQIQDAKFGINREQYQAMQAASDLQILLQMTDAQSNVAFKLATDEHVDMDIAFIFIYDFCQEIIRNNNATEKQILELLNANQGLIKLSLKFNKAVTVAKQMVDTLTCYGFDTTNIPDEIFQWLNWPELTFAEYVKLFHYHQKAKTDGRTKTAFDEYLNNIVTLHLHPEYDALFTDEELQAEFDASEFASAHEDLRRLEREAAIDVDLERWNWEQTYGNLEDCTHVDSDMDNYYFDKYDASPDYYGLHIEEVENPYDVEVD